MTVVVEARERSGSLITAAVAEDLGRILGAVPGRVTSVLSAGTNGLLARGARVVRGAGDVLDALFGAGAPTLPEPVAGPPLRDELRELVEAIGSGYDTLGALVGGGHPIGLVLTGLAELELCGHVRREAGGRYVLAIGA
jgi:DNA processing protein